MVGNINLDANKSHKPLLFDIEKVNTGFDENNEITEAPEANKNVMSTMDISRFVDSIDEMSSALSQFYGKVLQEKFNKNITKYSDKILDAKTIKDICKVFETSRVEELNISELLYELKRRCTDISDLILLLQGLVNDRNLDNELKEKLKVVIEIIEKDADPKELKGGINCALKAKIFGKHLSLKPSLLRAAYRNFISGTEKSLEFYENLITTFGYKKRKEILDFLEDALLLDIASQDPSSTALEFGYLIGKLKIMRQIKSSEHIFIDELINKKTVSDSGIDEPNLLSMFLSILRYPENTKEFINEMISVKKQLVKDVFISCVYSAIKDLPENIFEDIKDKDLILNKIMEMEDTCLLFNANKIKTMKA